MLLPGLINISFMHLGNMFLIPANFCDDKYYQISGYEQNGQDIQDNSDDTPVPRRKNPKPDKGIRGFYIIDAFPFNPKNIQPFA